MTKKRKVSEGDSAIIVFKTQVADCTVIETHRHNVKVKFYDGNEQEYQRGICYHETDRDLAILHCKRGK